MNRALLGQPRRQIVLDALNRAPDTGATRSELASATGLDYMAVVSALRTLVRFGQAEQRGQHYHATAEHAVDDHAVTANRTAAVRVIRNNPDNHHPLPSQRGQGATHRPANGRSSLTGA